MKKKVNGCLVDTRLFIIEGNSTIRFRKPSLKRQVIHRTGLKMPRGKGWIRDPKKYAYNKVYNKTSFDIFKVLKKMFKVLKTMGLVEMRKLINNDGFSYFHLKDPMPSIKKLEVNYAKIYNYNRKWFRLITRNYRSLQYSSDSNACKYG